MILQRIDAEILEIAGRIQRVQTEAQERIRELRRREQVLQSVRALITPEIETALRALASVGIKDIL